jgi:hypothetical protein
MLLLHACVAGRVEGQRVESAQARATRFQCDGHYREGCATLSCPALKLGPPLNLMSKRNVCSKPPPISTAHQQHQHSATGGFHRKSQHLAPKVIQKMDTVDRIQNAYAPWPNASRLPPRPRQLLHGPMTCRFPMTLRLDLLHGQTRHASHHGHDNCCIDQ